MPVRRRRGSPYWQITFRLAGREIRRTSGTANRREAEELEEEFRRDYWRQVKLGEKRFTWEQALERYQLEDCRKKSWERTARALARLSRFLAGAPLSEITRDSILKIRQVRARQVSSSSVNRELAVLRSLLNRCAHEWDMLDSAPKVPLFRAEAIEPSWITREQAHELLDRLPPHLADMARIALATGLRRANVTGLEWSRVDLARGTAFIPAGQAKGRKAIVVPLNAEAIAVLERWRGKHDQFVFVVRRIAPIHQVATKAWRTACTAVGLPGLRFHDLRHTWASWQVQAETPLSHLQELGGWSSFAMVQRYAHLSPGHLRQYADRTLIGEPVRTKTGTLENAIATARASR